MSENLGPNEVIVEETRIYEPAQRRRHHRPFARPGFGFGPSIDKPMEKIFFGHLSDGQLDFYDFLPLLAVIVGGGLLFVGLFPNLNTDGFFNLNNGQLIIGRRDGRSDDGESLLGDFMNNLEAGIVMINTIRREAVEENVASRRSGASAQGSCAKRLACKLGHWAKNSSNNLWLPKRSQHWLLEKLEGLIPETYARFSSSFKDVFTDQDDTSCDSKCYRCMAL